MNMLIIAFFRSTMFRKPGYKLVCSQSRVYTPLNKFLQTLFLVTWVDEFQIYFIYKPNSTLISFYFLSFLCWSKVIFSYLSKIQWATCCVRTLIALHHGCKPKNKSFASCRGRVNKIAWINVEFIGNSLTIAAPSEVKKCLRACATPIIPPWQINYY